MEVGDTFVKRGKLAFSYSKSPLKTMLHLIDSTLRKFEVINASIPRAHSAAWCSIRGGLDAMNCRFEIFTKILSTSTFGLMLCIS